MAPTNYNIPPLPSFSRKGPTSNEKENLNPPSTYFNLESSRNVGADEDGKKRPTLFRKRNEQTIEKSASSRMESSRKGNMASKARVLRFGETIDSLFCLSEGTSQEHRDICASIVNGEKVKDPSTWVLALNYAADATKSNPQLADMLIRLHKRATTRFPLRRLRGETFDTSHEKSLLDVWISYADVTATYLSNEDAEEIYNVILDSNVGEKEAKLYLHVSNFEESRNDTETAREYLQLGIEKCAQPIDVLKMRLTLKPDCMDIQLKSMEKSNEEKMQSNKTSKLGIPGYNMEISSSFEKQHFKKDIGDSISFQNNKVDEIGSNLINKSTERRLADKGSFSRYHMDLNEGHDRQGTDFNKSPDLHERVLVNETQRDFIDNQSNADENQDILAVKKSNSNIEISSSRILRRKRFQNDFEVSCTQENGSDVKYSSDNGIETSVRKRVRRIGKAERVVRVNEEENSGKIQASAVTETKKLTKDDLNYMIDWEPKKFTPEVVPVSMSNANFVAKMDVIEEESHSHAQSVTGKSIEVKMRKSNEDSRHLHDDASGHGRFEDTSLSHLSISSIKRKADTSPLDQNKNDILSNCNQDFLPLIEESNMIRVNFKCYAKLGVVGKGGSCKVYRALSKDCKVFGIKKVKLNGLEKQAIDGYKNEIALLNRLKGNKSIIQLFDSEVDLEDKKIFLVMELGEVDLFNVIKNGMEKHISKKERKREPVLNINFIRLTWQQMLSAVHSIHEEKIIHGDLKPANFLFVQGALKLIDFGIAKAIESNDTTNIYRDSHIGTMNYMSPEAILDSGSGDGKARMRVGRASDIWSLGCILYQLVYGTTPFAELHMIKKLNAIINPDHEISFPDVNAEVEVMLMKKCLQRKPKDRPIIKIIRKNAQLVDLESRSKDEKIT